VLGVLNVSSLGQGRWFLFRRSALVAFSAAYVALIFSCCFRALTLCLFCASRILASAACFCRSCFIGSRICRSSGGIVSLPLDGVVGLLVVRIGGSLSKFGCYVSSSVSCSSFSYVVSTFVCAKNVVA
jgi:hypothetical protein